MCLEHNGQTYIIVEFQHVKPGKGNAFVRTKLKNLTNGKVVDHTFPAGHKIDDVRVEHRNYQYLYDDDEYKYNNKFAHQQSRAANSPSSHVRSGSIGCK